MAFRLTGKGKEEKREAELDYEFKIEATRLSCYTNRPNSFKHCKYIRN